MLVADLTSADTYQQTFLEKSDETIPGTTSIGTSAAVLHALTTKGEAAFGISNTYGGLELRADRTVFPNYYQYIQRGVLKRIGMTSLPVIVNDTLVNLPAVQAGGDFVGDRAEFFFLDDERNPLTLAFRLGVGGLKPLTPDEITYCASMTKAGIPPDQMPARLHCDRPQGGDRDALRVIKISSPCQPAEQPARGGGGSVGAGAGVEGLRIPDGHGAGAGTGAASALEQQLADTGKADVYSIYFSFNSDAIREESEPTLKEIADLLRRHPDWRLIVNGHTDSIGGDRYNLDLSDRRAAAVKAALVGRYGIDATRLQTAGFGRSQPKDTNETLEGRARNRRVELVRQ